MEFINQVKKLKDQTQSKEIKDLCESYLSGNLNVSKEQFQNMINEGQSSPSGHKNVARNEEMEASKRIAQSLMESWDGLDKRNTFGNAGSYRDSLKETYTPSSINESSNYLYEESNKDKGLNKMGILESIGSIKKSPVYEFPAVKILCEKYSQLILNRNIPEFKLLNSFLSESSSFKWDDTVNNVFTNLSEKAQKYSREIEVSHVLEALKSSGNYSFYSELADTLNEWLNLEDNQKSSGLLAKNISKFSFNPIVKNLVNYLNIDEANGTKKLEIPTHIDGQSDVSRIYSPVAVYENSTLFSIGYTLFEASEEEIKKLNRNEAASIKDQDFISLHNALLSPNVKVNESGIYINFGKKMVKLVEESDDVSVYLGESKLNFGSLGELAKLLSLESSSYLRMNENVEISNIINLYRGYHNVVELDFAKSIKSNIYEGASINLMKWDGQLYLQRVNESMRENSIFKVNGSQAVKMVKDFLRYDISEGLTEFLEGENKVKSVMVNDRTKVIQNIQLVESEIQKIEDLITSNPLYASSKQILQAKAMLENELDTLKEKWGQINNEISKIDSDYSLEDDVMEDEKFNVGNYIKIKESGETGKIISIDGSSGRYTVLLDNGKTSDFMVNELMDMEDAFNAAESNYDEDEQDDYENDQEDEYGDEDENEYDEEDDEEEMKESNNFNKSELSVSKQKGILRDLANNHSFSKAPKGESDKIDMKMDSFRGYNMTMNEGNGKTPLAKAPGDSKMKSGKVVKKGDMTKAPGSDKMVKGKQVGKNLLDYDSHGAKGKIKFKSEDAEDSKYDMGYNIKEAKATSGMSNDPMMAKLNFKGKAAKATSGISNDPMMAKLNFKGKAAKATSGMSNDPEMADLNFKGKSVKATSGTTNDPMMAKLNFKGKAAKATSGMSNDPEMADLNFKGKSAKETPNKSGDLTKGQNLSEAEEVKKK